MLLRGGGVIDTCRSCLTVYHNPFIFTKTVYINHVFSTPRMYLYDSLMQLQYYPIPSSRVPASRKLSPSASL